MAGPPPDPRPSTDLRRVGVWAGVGLLVLAVAVNLFQFWMSLTHFVGTLALMAGAPVWFRLERAFGPGILRHGYPFWLCVALYLSVAASVAIWRGPAVWRWGRATLVLMVLWGYLVLSIGYAEAPRGRYLPPVPWLG